jgi:integrase
MIRTTKSLDGTRYRVRVGDGPLRTFTNRKDAENYEESQRSSRRRERAGLGVTKPNVSYGDLAKLYEANFDPTPWSQRMVAHSVRRFDKIPVRSINPEGIGAWLWELPHAEKTKLHILTAMRQVLNAGIEWGYLAKSPARRGGFKLPTGTRQREIRPFASWAEVESMADALGDTGWIVRFVCATGLSSPSEWINLTPAHFDLKAKTLRVDGTKTANRPRTIPLGEQAISAIQSLPWPLKKNTRLLDTFDYHEWRKTHWPAALAAAGLSKRTPYEMRHTFATLALEAGASLDAVSVALGHSDITITRRYYRKWTQPMDDQLRQALNTFGAAAETAERNAP